MTMTLEQFSDEFPELERYELREPVRYRFNANRREFVQLLGAGVAVTVMAERVHAQRPGSRGGSRAPRRDEKLAERFHLADDGIVTVFTSKVEVGQGSRTQIAQAAAEELRLPVERIRLVMADTGRCPDDGGTAGSRTTPSTVPRVRNAAAALRHILVQVAAEKLNADPTAIRFDSGKFTSGEKNLELVELIKDNAFTTRLDAAPPADVPLTDIANWQTLGKTVNKVTGPEVVTGDAKYPSDIIRPGMLYGKVLRPPTYNATLESIDERAVEGMEGVAVVRDGNFAACAAPNSWLAAKAVAALAKTASWKIPDSHPSSRELFDHLKRRSQNASERHSNPTPEKNSSESAEGEHKFQSTYTVAYIQHAPMEPRAAVAEWENGKLTVWTGSQQPSRVQGELAQAFRISTDAVRVIVPDTGGGFGGKHTGEVAVEAARLAKAAGKPVALRWSREEEFTWAYFRPAGVIDVRAAIDRSGKLTSWDFTNYNSGGSAIQTPYRVPNPRTQTVSSDAPLRQGSYRALASTANTFARESAMDELALLAKIDPREFRLMHLEDGRLKDVLIAVTERFDWQNRIKDVPNRRGLGLACGTEKGSFVAACAEVEMVDGAPRILGICQAYECGAIQNPGNLRAQVEGSIIMGLGGALTEAIAFENGRITNASFSTYRVPRIKDVPQIDIVLVDRRDLPSVGGGETPIIAVAPAIANAIAMASGKRLRSLPLVG